MDMVRIGMVGARYGATVHLQNLAALRGTRVQVTGICSQSRDSAEACARRFNIPFVTTDLAALLDRKDVDAVDLCVPNALHHAFAIQAAEAGKHVIVEKPLTGYFGEPGDPEPIGDRVPRAKMLTGARKNVAAVLEAVRRNRVTLGYAENWVYAPPVEKLRRLIQVSGGTILDLRAEENHSGSHSPYSRQWRHAGGGTLLRMGVHPVGAVLHLKAFEGQVRHGRPIRPVSVVADVAPLMRLEAARREQQKWIPADPEDEDWFRGYPQEMRDFVDAIREGREPLAGVTLAADCIEVIYAAYLSAEEGRRVPLQLI